MVPAEFRHYIIRPVLKYLNEFRYRYPFWTPDAEDIMLGIALVESNLNHIVQVGGGPALSLYQIEPATEQDNWNNWLVYHPQLQEAVRNLMGKWPVDTTEHLLFNRAYSTAHARIKLMRSPGAIPRSVRGKAEYWEKYYNAGGAGEAERYVKIWNGTRGKGRPQ